MPMSRLILIMLVLNSLLIVGGSALTYSLLKPLQGMSASPASGDVVDAPEVVEEAGEYTFFPVQKVIVSLRGENREHYFVLDLVLQADHEADIKKLEQIDPMVRNSVVAYLSGLSFSDLRGMPIGALQATLEKVLFDDFASKKIAAPFAHVLVSKLIVQ